MKATTTHWALISKVIHETGYSDDAIRQKIKKQQWLHGIHWKKAPDNRIVCDLIAINEWMGG